MVEAGYVFRVERESGWGPVDFLHLTDEELHKILAEKNFEFLRNMIKGLRKWINENVKEDDSLLVTTREQFAEVLRGEGMAEYGIEMIWSTRPPEPLNRGKLIASAKHCRKTHPHYFKD